MTRRMAVNWIYSVCVESQRLRECDSAFHPSSLRGTWAEYDLGYERTTTSLKIFIDGNLKTSSRLIHCDLLGGLSTTNTSARHTPAA